MTSKASHVGRKCRECAKEVDCYEIKKDWDNCCYHTFYAGIVKMTIRKPAQKIKEGNEAHHCKNNLFIKEYGGRNKPPTHNAMALLRLCLFISYYFECTRTCVCAFKIYMGFGS